MKSLREEAKINRKVSSRQVDNCSAKDSRAPINRFIATKIITALRRLFMQNVTIIYVGWLFEVCKTKSLFENGITPKEDRLHDS